MNYRLGSGDNPLWDQFALELFSMSDFRNVVFALADELPSPRKEYWKILSLSGTSANIQKYSRTWLYETYAGIKDTNGISRSEMNRVKGLVLGALFMDYRYEDADHLAGELLEEEVLPTQVYYNLADFYSKTRRYDEADDAMNAAAELYGEEQTKILFGKIAENNKKYREKEAVGKQQYMPNPKEDREAARKAYVDYLASIGIDAEMPETTISKKNVPTAIPKDQYPNPNEIRDADFDTFVAYDLETTGISTKIDAIIEIGAIKVYSGKVLESKEYIFQEFVRPFKKNIREEVTALTGITKEDVL